MLHSIALILWSHESLDHNIYYYLLWRKEKSFFPKCCNIYWCCVSFE